MKKTLVTAMMLGSFVGQMQATVILGGDFQMYKAGSGNTVTATFGPGDSYVAGVGSGLQVSGGSVTYSDLSAPGVPGGVVDIDLPGWLKLQGSNDLAPNGVGGSTGVNIFAEWGGDCRLETAASVGTIGLGQTYTITAMVNGDAGSPIAGPLAFHLLADGVLVTPTSLVDPVGPFGSFQEISRTYAPATLAGLDGKAMTIVIGVENANDFGGRVIFDDVSLSLVAIPEPTSTLLGGLGVLALLRRRRHA